MRLSPSQAQIIHNLALEVAGSHAQVRLFGSRLDDAARGGDVDLLLELPAATDNPAWLAATFSAKVSRALDGRQVDVLISAPGLKHLPIHEIALREGQVL